MMRCDGSVCIVVHNINILDDADVTKFQLVVEHCAPSCMKAVPSTGLFVNDEMITDLGMI